MLLPPSTPPPALHPRTSPIKLNVLSQVVYAGQKPSAMAAHVGIERAYVYRLAFAAHVDGETCDGGKGVPLFGFELCFIAIREIRDKHLDTRVKKGRTVPVRAAQWGTCGSSCLFFDKHLRKFQVKFFGRIGRWGLPAGKQTLLLGQISILVVCT